MKVVLVMEIWCACCANWTQSKKEKLVIYIGPQIEKNNVVWNAKLFLVGILDYIFFSFLLFIII